MALFIHQARSLWSFSGTQVNIQINFQVIKFNCLHPHSQESLGYSWWKVGSRQECSLLWGSRCCPSHPLVSTPFLGSTNSDFNWLQNIEKINHILLPRLPPSFSLWGEAGWRGRGGGRQVGVEEGEGGRRCEFIRHTWILSVRTDCIR